MKSNKLKFLAALMAVIGITQSCASQEKIQPIKGTPSEVDFSWHLRDWDGFGFNYVQTAHTYDYDAYPQEYGGFSLLDDQEKADIIDMVFGEDGLKVALVKLFLDPLHQSGPNQPFQHEKSTSYMLEFAEMGLKKTRERGAELSMITTLFGPPGWVTLQGFDHARDLDPKHKDHLANYYVDWAKFLVNEKKFPLHYISLYNEGEDWLRWAHDGTKPGIFDYNMYWPPNQVNDFLRLMPSKLEAAGLRQVKVTNGEPTNWYRFMQWGIASNIFKDKKALSNLGLITSHGFYAELNLHRWFGDHNSVGTDLLRSERPELHAWVTSTGWGNMDVFFIREIYGNIYTSKVNGIIPWAGIQRPVEWEGGDPNAGCAFKVNEDGSYEIRKGYYFYKQVSRAGQPGMAVAQTYAMDSQTPIIAFAANGTENPDAFIVINYDQKWEKGMSIKIKGTSAKRFKAFRTDSKEENYAEIGVFSVEDGELFYRAPIGSVTTFYGLMD